VNSSNGCLRSNGRGAMGFAVFGRRIGSAVGGRRAASSRPDRCLDLSAGRSGSEHTSRRRIRRWYLAPHGRGSLSAPRRIVVSVSPLRRLEADTCAVELGGTTENNGWSSHGNSTRRFERSSARSCAVPCLSEEGWSDTLEVSARRRAGGVGEGRRPLDIAEGIVMALRRTDPALHSPKWSTSQAITV